MNGGTLAPSDQPDVSRETLRRLEIFASLLLSWNRTINLIAKNDEPNLWHRHIRDALTLLPFIPPQTARATDLGSGAGFPGLVLAIATDIPFDLVESDTRKAAFLREAARATKARVAVHAVRIEVVKLPPSRLVVARALAPLPLLLAMSHRLLASDGVCLFPKGRTATDELTSAARQWQMRIEQWPNPLDPSARILRLSEISRVPD